MVGELESWIAGRSGWPPLVTSIARKWLDEGIRGYCITRDLTWGVPVPKPGYEEKVFYVRFDVPVASEFGTTIAVACTTTSPRESGSNACLFDSLSG